MHRVSLALEGAGALSTSLEFPDGDAFVMYLTLRATLHQGTPAKRKPRRGATVASEDADAVEAPVENDES